MIAAAADKALMDVIGWFVFCLLVCGDSSGMAL
jgi:hypothetical protein